MSDILLQEREARLLTLTLNRPDQRNALTRELISALHAAVAKAATDDEVGALVLTGSGRAFCAGLDLQEVERAAAQQQQADVLMDLLHDLLEAIRQCPKPVIAAVGGFAVAGGAALVTACDVVIASDLARLGYPEITRGLVAAIVMPDLLRQIGERQARYLLLTGQIISAEDAKQMGLVNEVVRQADLLMRAKHLARQMGDLLPDALRLTKQWARQAQSLPPDSLREYNRQFAAPKSS